MNSIYPALAITFAATLSVLGELGLLKHVLEGRDVFVRPSSIHKVALADGSIFVVVLEQFSDRVALLSLILDGVLQTVQVLVKLFVEVFSLGLGVLRVAEDPEYALNFVYVIVLPPFTSFRALNVEGDFLVDCKSRV